jgi:hypothetical protein
MTLNIDHVCEDEDCINIGHPTRRCTPGDCCKRDSGAPQPRGESAYINATQPVDSPNTSRPSPDGAVREALTTEQVARLIQDTMRDKCGVFIGWQSCYETAAALSQPPQADVRCARCGSSGDVFMMCAGCQSPLSTPPSVALNAGDRNAVIENCAKIAEAIDSGRGNEKEIAKAIRALARPQEGAEVTRPQSAGTKK